jgi:hypothetical protein
MPDLRVPGDVSLVTHLVKSFVLKGVKASRFNCSNVSIVICLRPSQSYKEGEIEE